MYSASASHCACGQEFILLHYTPPELKESHPAFPGLTDSAAWQKVSVLFSNDQCFLWESICGDSFMPAELGLKAKQNFREALTQPRLNQKYLLQLPSSIRQFLFQRGFGIFHFRYVLLCWEAGSEAIQPFLSSLGPPQRSGKTDPPVFHRINEAELQGHEGGLLPPHTCTIFRPQFLGILRTIQGFLAVSWPSEPSAMTVSLGSV